MTATISRRAASDRVEQISAVRAPYAGPPAQQRFALRWRRILAGFQQLIGLSADEEIIAVETADPPPDLTG